ncbi:MAG TPA: hypothetical protein VNQ73_15430 [Ilumatobacter sp.]|nr:hypothetical protein [Ilumatobacter sp.]
MSRDITMVEMLGRYLNRVPETAAFERLLTLPRVKREPAPPALNRKRYLSADAVAELVAMYQAGATVYELAEQFGIHRDRVSKLVKSAGVQVRDHERVVVDLDLAAVLHAQGLSLTDVAKRLAVGRTALIRARREARDRQS